ncbi:MAG: glycosyltransferase [Thermoanaerobaculia bacterium]
MSADYSIVIPSFERRAVLAEVLEALERQRDAPSFETIVVDDGSHDGSAEFVAELAQTRPIRLLVQEHRGPATARNRGVAEAGGRRVAFLGDDTVPEPDWLRLHDEAARAAEARSPGGEVAVVGRVDWHPRMHATELLHYLNEQGLQFGFALIDDPQNVPFNFFYTSNLSLSRERLLAEPFDERFPYPAWEDIEAAYRLTRRGLRLVYEPRARVLHDHPTGVGRFAHRQERAGYCAVVFARLHPELAGFVGLGPDGPPPLPSRLRALGREGVVRALQFFPVRLPELWELVFRFHYVRGMHRAWRELPLARKE